MADLTSRLRQRFPNASPSFWRLNEARFHAEDSGAAAVVERTPTGKREGGPVAAHPNQKGTAPRFRVCICSVRKRLLDADNICPKFTIDALRRKGIIRDDSPKHIILEVSQRKAAKGEEEHTEINIYEHL